jgi:hypothetical protein
MCKPRKRVFDALSLGAQQFTRPLGIHVRDRTGDMQLVSPVGNGWLIELVLTRRSKLCTVGLCDCDCDCYCYCYCDCDCDCTLDAGGAERFF